MKVNTEELSKLYYSIGEVAEMFDVNTSLLRYWEGEFPALKPRKKRGGVRLYTVKDIEAINRIYYLLKQRGFTIEGARKAYHEPKAGDRTKQDSSRVENLNQAMNRLKRSIDRLKKVRNSLE